MPTSDAADLRWMRVALNVAARGLGQAAPNPAVGCVIVKDGQLVASACTAPGGRPHAETQALVQAGAAARGGTAYVTLEPCAHHGQTGPCAAALAAAGLARVVVAMADPDPRVAGRGLEMLRHAGIAVKSGVLAAEAAALNAGFLLRIRDGRPLFTLKLATSLDGRMALANGKSQWLTGEMARAAAHGLRARHDAVLVGIGTALADDPLLTCRLPGCADRRAPRILLDRRLRLPLSSKLVRSARAQPLWVLAGPEADGTALRAAGVVVQPVADLAAAARWLGAQGLTRVLVEGGAQVATAFLQAGMVDRLEWFTAPKVLGGDARPAVEALCLDELPPDGFVHTASRQLGMDRWESFVRKEAA